MNCLIKIKEFKWNNVTQLDTGSSLKSCPSPNFRKMTVIVMNVVSRYLKHGLHEETAYSAPSRKPAMSAFLSQNQCEIEDISQIQSCTASSIYSKIMCYE